MQTKHKYIEFWNEMTLNYWDGYLIREDESSFYMVTPVCYEWLMKTNREEWLEEIFLSPFLHSFYCPLEIKQIPIFFTEEYLWILEFPLVNEDKEHFHLIGNFFEHFRGCRIHNSKDLKQSLVHCISKVKKLIPEQILSRIITFVLQQYEKINPVFVQRLDLLFFNNLLK